MPFSAIAYNKKENSEKIKNFSFHFSNKKDYPKIVFLSTFYTILLKSAI